MRREKDPRRARRRKIHWLIFFEIVCMAIGVACVLLPTRWRVLTLIVLGAREILVKAHTRLKQTDKLEGELKADYGKKQENEEPARGNADGESEKSTGKTRAEKRGKQKLDGGKTLRARSK